MPENQLNIINIEEDPVSSKKKNPHASLKAREKEMQAKFERLWLLDPNKFNPLRNCLEKERLDRTWNLLNKLTTVNGKKVGDIGCAAGVFSRLLRDAGAHVLAVDIAENAIKQAKEYECANIEFKRDTMPSTSLSDQSFDVVVCTDVIAYLSPLDFRLFFAELARLVKTNEGIVVCSTPIDIYSIGAVQRFVELAHTEFDLIASLASYHALYLRIKHFFEIPQNYLKGWKNHDYKKKELNKRSPIGRLWYRFNSSLLIWFWWIINVLFYPINKLLNSSRFILITLEKICRFFSSDDGISHFIIIGKKRPLVQEDPDHIPINRPKKREIWE